MIRNIAVWAVLAGVCAGCASPEPTAPTSNKVPPRFELRLAQHEPGDGFVPAGSVGQSAPIYIASRPLVTIDDVTDADGVKNDDASRVAIRLKFRRAAAERLEAATRAHIGKPLAILIDQRVASAPVLRSALGASVAIDGDFEEQEIAALVTEFRIIAKKNRSQGPVLCRLLAAWC